MVTKSHRPVPWAQGWRYTFTIFASYAVVMLAARQLTTQDPLGALPVPDAAKEVARSVSAWLNSWATEKDMPKEERLRLLYEEDVWKNSLVMWMFPDYVREAMPHFVQSWLRCWILCAAVYFGTGAVWAYYTYYCFGDYFFKTGKIPAFKDIWEQIKVSNFAMPMYSLLPAAAEYAAEKGLAMTFPRVDNVGLPMYIFYFIMYMVSVEFGVYWMHRGLHDIKWAYKHLHYAHHIYNKEHTLSPFAGLAFHPIDGIIQAVAYVWTLFYCPTHFLTHEVLLFATGVWTTNIHDCIHGKVWPIMGAGYHTIHHTTYKHNYGHYTIFFDALYNTCITPEEHEEGAGWEVESEESGAEEVEAEEEVVVSGGKTVEAKVTVRAGKKGQALQEEPASPKKAMLARTMSPAAPATGPRTRNAAKSAIKA